MWNWNSIRNIFKINEEYKNARRIDGWHNLTTQFRNIEQYMSKLQVTQKLVRTWKISLKISEVEGNEEEIEISRNNFPSYFMHSVQNMELLDLWIVVDHKTCDISLYPSPENLSGLSPLATGSRMLSRSSPPRNKCKSTEPKATDALELCPKFNNGIISGGNSNIERGGGKVNLWWRNCCRPCNIQSLQLQYCGDCPPEAPPSPRMTQCPVEIDIFAG